MLAKEKVILKLKLTNSQKICTKGKIGSHHTPLDIDIFWA